MNPYANEEVMWQRLKDLQREAETSRLFAQNALPGFVQMVELLGRWTWNLVRRPAHRTALRVVEGDQDGASRVA